MKVIIIAHRQKKLKLTVAAKAGILSFYNVLVCLLFTSIFLLFSYTERVPTEVLENNMHKYKIMFISKWYKGCYIF